MRRLNSAVSEKGATPRSVRSIFREFPENDSAYAVAESVVSKYFRDYAEAELAEASENLCNVLLSYLYPDPIYKDARQYLLEKFYAVRWKKENIHLLFAVFAHVQTRFPEDHEVRRKLSDVVLAACETWFCEHEQDEVMLSELLRQMPYGAQFSSLRDKVISTLLVLAEKNENVTSLEALVTYTHNSSELNRTAAFAFARVIFKRHGVYGLAKKFADLLYHEASEGTGRAIVKEMNPLIDADIDTAIAKENVGHLLFIWPHLLAWGDGRERYQRVLSVLLEIAVEKRDVNTLKGMYVTLAKNDEAWDIVSKTLIDLAIDVGDAETLKMVTNTIANGEHCDRAIRARVALIHTQGLLP